MEKDIEYYKEAKRRLMNAANEEISPEARLVLCNAVNYCDRKIGDILRMRRLMAKLKLMVVIVSLIAIASIFLTGCLEHTMKGAGKMIQGTGSLVSGVGTDVYRAADGYGKQ